jgi:glucosamine-6-phosphate deaminase
MHPNIVLFTEEDYEAVSRKAADIFAEALTARPDGVYGLATGGTPAGLYKELVRRHKEGGLDFSRMTSFNLDEYHPIQRDDPHSFHSFMREHLFSHVNIAPERAYIPDGEAADPAAECDRYEFQIETAGWLDLVVLGIGQNGHIAFNEPAESFSVRTACVTLAETTARRNARFFDSPGQMPKHALTMGIRTIMMSGRILLLVVGEDKADILRDALTGPVTPLVPASALQLHRDVTVVADRAAASLL